mgnify:CR=1 FL=1
MKICQAVLACGSGIESENATNEKDPRNPWAAYVIRYDPRGNRLWEIPPPHSSQRSQRPLILGRMQGWGGIIFLESDNTGSQKEENLGFLKLAEEKLGK